VLMTIAEVGGALPFLIAGRRLPRVDSLD